MKYKNTLIVTIGLNLSACGGSNDTDDVITKSCDDFVNEVQSSVGENAKNCGTVAIEESQLEPNTCVAGAFANDQPFYAAYELRGVDSQVGAALTGDENGEIRQWRYDSNPAGGVPASSSKIESTECTNASLTGSVDSGYEEIFSCEWTRLEATRETLREFK